MRFLLWLITLPLIVAAVVFSVANRGVVEVDLWPFEKVAIPVYLFLLVSLFIGFVLGAFIVVFSGGKARTRAREAEYRAGMLERENQRLKNQAPGIREPMRTSGVPTLPAK